MADTWYVNLPEDFDRDGATNHGQTIPFKIRRKTKARATSVTRRKVAWQVVSDPDLSVAEYVAEADRPSFEKGHRTKEKLGGTFKNSLTLPHVGGVRYTVAARKASDEGAERLEAVYESRRLLYYTVNYMNATCRDLFEAIEARWREVYAGAAIDSLPAGGPDELFSLRSPRRGEGTFPDRHRGELDRAPFHLRVLLLGQVGTPQSRDLQVELRQGAEEELLRVEGGQLIVTAQAPADRFDRNWEVPSLALVWQAVPLAIPAEAVARHTERSLRIDLTHGDENVQQVRSAVARGQPIKLGGVVSGLEAPAVDDRERQLAVRLQRAHTQDEPLVENTVRVWCTAGRIHIQLDEETFRENPIDTPILRTPGANPYEGQATIYLGLVDVAEADCLSIEVGADDYDEIFEREFRVRLAVRPARDRVLAHAELVDLTASVEGDSLIVPSAELLQLPNVVQNDITCSIRQTLELGGNAPPAVVWADDFSTFTFALPAGAAAAYAIGHVLHVNLTLTWAETIAGYHTQGTPTIVLTCFRRDEDEDEALTQNRMLAIASHELGHALGMTFSHDVRTDGARLGQNPRYYTDHGGTGPHCKLNCEPDNGIMRPTEGPLCLMFHTVTPLEQQDVAFCDVCQRHLTYAHIELPH